MILLTMVNASARSAADTRTALTDAGYHVLRTQIPRQDAKDGYAQAFGKPVRRNGGAMKLLAEELLDEVTR